MKYIYRKGKLVPKDIYYVGISRGPYVISDTMDPVEQVDGKFYESKSRFRAVGRSLGLIEVGNEKFPPKWRSTDLPATKRARREAVKMAVQKFRAGYRG